MRLTTEQVLRDAVAAFHRGEIPLTETAEPLHRHILHLVESGEMFDLLEVGYADMFDAPLHINHSEGRDPRSVEKFNTEAAERHKAAHAISKRMVELKALRRYRASQPHRWFQDWVTHSQTSH